MRLKVTFPKETKHQGFLTCVGWLNADEVFTSGDDHQIIKSNQLTGETTLVTTLSKDLFPTDFHWFPKSVGGKKQGPSEIFLLASAEGKFYFVSKNGRIEKTVEGHQGAILSGRWSYDGNAFLTAGEDGQVKIWSRSGMLRSTLVTLSVPVYSAAWSPNSDAVLHSNGMSLCVKPLQPSVKPQQWKAHDGLILKVDWNIVNNTIISAGEDCKYKVWDVYGRPLFSSLSHDYPITSLAWAPDGSTFAVGSYNTLRLCDKVGWSHCLEKPSCGSLLNISWANDSTQIAATCGNGQILFADVIERRVEWKNLEVMVAEDRLIKVRDVLTEAKENLEFRDRVVKFALSFDHLVVTTSSQCYFYSVRNWNTPVIFDLKSSSVYLVLLAEKHFILVDDTGLQVYSYEGRLICTPRYNGMRPDLLNKQIVSISNDSIAIRDRADEKALFFFEALNGKPIGDGKPVKHTTEIVEIALNQCGSSADRQLAIIDKNKDLFLRTVRQFGSDRVVKLSTMVSSICWNDSCNILTTISDNKVTFWYYPAIAYVDQELLPKTLTEREQGEFGKELHIVNFTNTLCQMRRGDGALCSTSISPYPSFLHKFTRESKWEDAVRLCRFVKETFLWACLAGMSTAHNQLATAEIAYAAIDEVEKVQYINYIKDIPSPEGRNAATALFCGQVQDAEVILLQSGLIYRAIQMHIDQFNWNRALELAVKHKTHVDTVLAYRESYLKICNRTEKNAKFIQFSEGVATDWDKINAKMEMELDKESQRPGSKPFMG